MVVSLPYLLRPTEETDGPKADGEAPEDSFPHRSNRGAAGRLRFLGAQATAAPSIPCGHNSRGMS